MPSFLDPVLNPILLPLLNLSPFWGVVVLSLFISLIIVLVYKYFTNQNEMKKLKDEQKEYQQKLKELRDKPEEMMKVQKEAMKKNFEYMKHSLKATLITFIPILLIFGWMNAHLAYEPIFPGESYSMTATFKDGVTGEVELVADENTELASPAKQNINEGKATWNLKSSAGEHLLTIKVGTQEQTKKVLISKELQMEDALSLYQHSDIQSIRINYDKLKPLGMFSLFGWYPGWLGLYIIFSLIFSLGLRKVMKVY